MDKVTGYLKANKQRFVDLLCEYLRIPSVSAQAQHKGDTERCAQWIEKHLSSLGLQTKLYPTAGNPIVVARTSPKRNPNRKTFLVYGHYDVQPPEPLNLWKSPPFEPRIKGDSLFARGATDNKGQHMAHINALEAYLKTGTELPCDLVFLIEGEEEVGSDNLTPFLSKYKKELACDAVVISDTGMPGLKQPALTYGLRGIIAVEVKVHGPSRDLHSGIFGGTVDNPALVLSQLLAGVRNAKGKITIPGFYDDVQPLTKYERAQLARLSLDEKEYAKFLGVPQIFGESGFTPVEQRSARPTFEINGMTSGYQGEGSKTIIPSWASAKITCRLVPNQDPNKVRETLLDYFQKEAPPTVRVEVKVGHGGEAYLFDPSQPKAQAALRALRLAFEAEPVLLREGGSIPIVNQFKKILNADSIMLGLALPEDNAHSPNEKFSLTAYQKGMLMSAHLWQELAAVKD
ncbi:MAG: dipeptidase [Verrucomicrobiales bacterium]